MNKWTLRFRRHLHNKSSFLWISSSKVRGQLRVVIDREMVRAWQQRELAYLEQIKTLRHSDQALRAKLQKETANNASQTKLVEKLQRKLLSVAEQLQQIVAKPEDSLGARMLELTEEGLTHKKVIKMLLISLI